MHSNIYGNFYVMHVSVWVGGRKGTFNWEITFFWGDGRGSLKKGVKIYVTSPM